MKLRRWHLIVVVAIAAVAVLVAVKLRGGATPATESASEWPPLPHRVTVEVLNSGNAVGAARIATARLRRGGLDVVSYRNADPELHDTALIRPLVLVRRGDTTGVGRIRSVLGSLEVRDAPDPRPLVDLSVIIGSDPAAGPD